MGQGCDVAINLINAADLGHGKCFPAKAAFHQVAFHQGWIVGGNHLAHHTGLQHLAQLKTGGI